MQKITPFLWFDREAGEAMDYYTSIFKNSKKLGVNYYPEGSPAPTGSVMTASFELEGLVFTALNAGPIFKFNEAISFVIHCENQDEVDYYWKAFTREGEESMCGWLKDKYGLSWQVVPTELMKMTGDSANPEKAKRAMQSMMTMRKIDLNVIRSAYEGR